MPKAIHLFLVNCIADPISIIRHLQKYHGIESALVSQMTKRKIKRTKTEGGGGLAMLSWRETIPMTMHSQDTEHGLLNTMQVIGKHFLALTRGYC